MSDFTTVKIKKSSRAILRKIESQLQLVADGEKISTDQAIECLYLGHKNPDFNEAEFLQASKAA